MFLLLFFRTVYKDFAEELEQQSTSKSPSKSIFLVQPLTLSLVAVFYFWICSNERIFQSMQSHMGADFFPEGGRGRIPRNL